ncbi:MAG: hypothetical protein WCO00_10460 [Rhodospirillaceae bacterium]
MALRRLGLRYGKAASAGFGQTAKGTTMKIMSTMAGGKRLLPGLLFAALAPLLLWGAPTRAQQPQQPAQAQQQPHTVEAGVYITNIQDIALAASTYKVTFWVWFKTSDEKYEPEKSIDIIGSKEIKTDSLTLDKLPDGRFYRSVRVTATVSQKFDVGYFPFDTQNLRIVLESTTDDASRLKFTADTRSSGVDPNIVLPGWKYRALSVRAETNTYNSDFGDGDGSPTTYARLVTEVTLDHAGGRIFGTNFLGFFVADLLTGVTMAVESFAVTRAAIPFVGRLNMVAGSLFGAVGNAYLVEKLLPPTPNLTLTDLVQVSSFSSIAFALFTAIGTETMARMGYLAPAISGAARTSVAIFLGSQVAMAIYFATHANNAK